MKEKAGNNTELDKDLVLRVQQGDKSAYDLLVIKYQHRIIQLVNRYVKDPSEAQDVAQEAFIKAYRALGNFRGDSAFYTWLYRIAINTAKNYLVSVFYVMHRFFNAELTFARIVMVKNHKAATEQLDSLHEHLSRSHHQRLMIDVLGMKALQADTDGDAATAVALLEQAVLLGQTGQLVRPLANLGPELFKLLDRLNLDQEGSRYVKMIFSAQPASVNASKDSTEHQYIYEVLSRREIQILELLARNMSNKEIAQQLYISTGTVKRHAHNIYGKLDVSDRRKAVSKATGLGILKKD